MWRAGGWMVFLVMMGGASAAVAGPREEAAVLGAAYGGVCGVTTMCPPRRTPSAERRAPAPTPRAPGHIDYGGGGYYELRSKGKRKKKIGELVIGEVVVAPEGCASLKQEVQAVVIAKQNAFRYCYEKELQTKPTLSGEIVAQWSVSLDGSVMKPSIASTTMNDSTVEGCIVRVIERTRYEPRSGEKCQAEVKFRYKPLIKAPKDNAKGKRKK